MSVADQIQVIEDDLRGRGLPVAELFRRAGIQSSTWWRWKAGRVSPNFSTFDKVTGAHQSLIAEHDAACEASTGTT